MLTLHRPERGRRSGARTLTLVPMLVGVLAASPAWSSTAQPTEQAATDSPATAGKPQRWTHRPPLRNARFTHDVVTANGWIFAIGGTQSVEARRVTGDGRWREVAPLPTLRYNVGVGELDDQVYVAGGINDDNTPSDVVERYNPRTGKWGRIANLPEPRGAPDAAGLGGRFYVAGGLGNDDTALNTVIAYNPRTDSWSPVASMNSPRARLRLVAAGAYLYAIGGLPDENEAGLSTVERYDPRTNKWTMVASMHRQHALAGVATVRQGHRLRIAVIAGFTSDGVTRTALSSTEVYDVTTNRWHELRAQLPQPRASLGGAVESGGAILAIGGFVGVPGAGGHPTDEVLALKI